MKSLIMPLHPVQGDVTSIALNAYIVNLFPFYHSSGYAVRNHGFLARFSEVPRPLSIRGGVNLPAISLLGNWTCDLVSGINF